MDNSFIEEYLIAIGAKTDSQSFEDAKRKTSDLESHLRKIEKATAFTALLQGVQAFINAANFAVGVVKKLGNALYENIVGVARADMQYMKLARSMWVTKETAKGLQMAMDEMGASMDDIAWIPELRDQFHRLQEEINRFSTPADADNQLKYIRSIGYDIQALFIRLKMLREWIVYYLIKYLQPFLDEFKGFIKWVSDQLGGNMSQMAKKFAEILSSIIGSLYSAFKVASKVIQSVAEWITELPANVKKWAAVFAAVGAAIMAGPFGIFLAAIAAAFVLIQDFVYYMNGWSSSKTMAPVWEALMKFTRGTGSNIMTRIREFLSDVADILDRIINDLQIRQVFDDVKDAVWEVFKGFKALWDVNNKQFREFFKLLGIGKPQVSSFVGTLARGISMGIRNMAEFVKLVGKVIQAAALIKDGKFSEAGKLFKDSVVDFGKNVWNNTKQFWGSVFGGAFGGDGNVVGAASEHLGEQWMDPTGANTDAGNQCASFVSAMYQKAGISGLSSMNGDILAGQFGEAYHPVGDGYVPKPGDMIDWGHHVGIYAGNGEYIARNSRGGVTRGSMAGMEEYFGPLLGYGSISEYKQNTNQLNVGASNANNTGDTTQTWARSVVEGTTSSLLPGSNETAMSPLQGFNMGGISIGAINIGGTNATPQEIANAVQDGVFGAINARYQRGFVP